MKVKRSSSKKTASISKSSVEAKAAKMASAIPAKTPTAAPEAKVSKAQPAEPKRTGVNRGLKSGLRIMEFQDRTFAENDQKVRPTLGGTGFRTDEELAKEWCAEFPQSLAVTRGRITADMVRAVRHLYNNGTGGHGTVGKKHESQAYSAEGNKRVPVAYVRTRTAPAVKAAEPVEAPVAAKRKAVLVKAKGKKIA